MPLQPLSRREFLRCSVASGLWAAATGRARPENQGDGFKLRFVLSTNLYGKLPISDIVPEVHHTSSEALDIWAGRWGNQREQIDALGHDRFSAMLTRHAVKVGTYTCMDPGFLRAGPHMRAMKKFGGDMIVAGFGGGGPGASKLRGAELRRAIRVQVEKLRPAFDQAGELGVKLAIENHLNSLLETPDALPMLADAIPARHVGIAFAPFHLPQDAPMLGRLVGDLGDRILYFYAWQFGDGSGDLPPPRQRRQLPGVGPLDFKPMLAALKRQRFAGWTSVFMHPTPRGSPLHPTIAETSDEIVRTRRYLESELQQA